MAENHVTSILTDPVTVELIERSPLMRLGYTGLDGAPRVVPLAYVPREEEFVFCTIIGSAKVPALRRDPRVAITIDESFPPCCLLVRGLARLEIVDGIPPEYLQAAFRTMPPEAHEQFEQQVRGLYDQMVRITVAPTWARLNDFVRTAPRAVEQAIAAKASS